MIDDLDAKEFGEHLDMARDEMEELREWDARKPEVQARVLRAYAKKFCDDQDQQRWEDLAVSDELRELCLIIGGLVLGAAVLLLVIASIGSRIAFPAEVAEIESLRVNAANVDPQQAEDVIGQVVEVNRKIAANRAWNKVPILSISVPNGWDNVEPIPVPKGRI